MRYRLMATYRDSPFEAGIGPADGDIVLFAACPPPEELGFEPATGHWRKQLRLGDVQAVWESRPVGTFRGERCMVLDDLGDRLHIGYLGHDGYKAEQLGYWQVDRGVFELIAPRTEVTDILEERTEYSRPAETPGYQEPAYQAPGYQVPDYQPPGQPAGADYPWQPGQYSAQPEGLPGDQGQAAPVPPVYYPAPDDTTGVALPVTAEAPLPLEAQALRAASASRRPRPAQPAQPAGPAHPASPAQPGAAAGPAPAGQDSPRQRRAGRRRLATERLFADLAGLAGIPSGSYSVGDDVEGALCLVQTDTGFEVFHSAGGARHELQVFSSEEAACFYLFGVLAAEAVRNGTLARVPSTRLA